MCDLNLFSTRQSRHFLCLLGKLGGGIDKKSMIVDGIFDCFHFHFNLIFFAPRHVNILTVKWQTVTNEKQTPH